MKNAFTGWRYLWTSQDIRRKLIITIILLVIFRLAANVPVPGINGTALKSLLQGSGSFFAFLDLLSGGTISHFSLLAMGVYPYITAQIILQLLTPIFPALQRKMEEDPREGRKWQEKWTYYLSVPMALLSALGQINLFNSYSVQGGQGQIVPFGFTSALWLPSVTLLVTMVAGTMFAIWLGELISEYGIRGQGLSLIIFAGIVARMPASFASLLADKQHGWILVISMVIVMVAVIYAIVYVQQGRRYVPVMYPGRRVGSRMSMPVKGTLPLMVNLAGMIPLIFASAILQFPSIIASYFVNSANATVAKFATVYSDHVFQWRLGLLPAVLPDGCELYFLLYRRYVLPAELWRKPEESRCADPGCKPWSANPEIPDQGTTSHHSTRCFFPGCCCSPGLSY